jgi:hypothetical protein
MSRKPRLAVVIGVALAMFLGLATLGTARQAASNTKKAESKSESTVYVCACKGESSCPCMSMAKMKSKCACGEHSPDMKAVAANSEWAKKNRKALE